MRWPRFRFDRFVSTVGADAARTRQSCARRLPEPDPPTAAARPPFLPLPGSPRSVDSWLPESDPRPPNSLFSRRDASRLPFLYALEFEDTGDTPLCTALASCR